MICAEGKAGDMSSPASTSVAVASSSAGPAIFWAGLLCGVLDITAAFVTWAPKGISPARILRGIAGGLLGPRASQGGAATAALGLAIHFLIAFSAAAVFYAISRRVGFLIEQAVLSGVLYGVAVYLFMYWVVVPLSRLPRRPFSWTPTIIAVVTHIVCVGLPIALVVRRFSRTT